MERQERLSSIEGKCGFVDVCSECEKEHKQQVGLLEDRIRELTAKIQSAEQRQIADLQSKLTQAEARIEALEEAGKALVDCDLTYLDGSGVRRCVACSHPTPGHDNHCLKQALAKLLNGGSDA